MPCKWCIYKQMLSLNRKKIKFISKKTLFTSALYCNVPQSQKLDCDAQEAFLYVTRRNIPRQSFRHKQVSASGFPRHPLLSYFYYVIEIITPRVQREPETSVEIRFNRPLVFSNDTFLSVFKKLASNHNITVNIYFVLCII